MFSKLVVLSIAVSSVYGHAFVNSVSGANGLTSVGLGVTTNGEVARGGTTEQPFQLDTPVLKNTVDDPCGATLLAGSVNIGDSMSKVAKTNGGQLPSIPNNGVLTMGIFQVNADGGGPFAAEINADATGKTWEVIKVVKQPPGALGLLHNGPANSTITVQVPANTKCTGGANKNACVIRLNNGGPNTGSVANGAGPFGGCVAVQQGGNGGAAGNGNGAGKAGNGKNGAGNGNANGAGNGNANGAGNGNANGAGKAGKADGNAQDNKPQRRAVSRLFYPSVSARDVAAREFDAAPLERRQKLTAQMIDELETATGTAIDIPIDSLAGHNDEGKNGGNSTAPARGAVLSDQQAVDLKKAVQNAIAQALTIMSQQDEIDAGAGGQDSKITDKTNLDAKIELEAGRIQSINAGNAGVGTFQTDVVNSLNGGLATATNGLSSFAAGATATGTAASATITAAPTATAAGGQGRGGKQNGNGAGKQNGNGAGKQNGNGAQGKQNQGTAANNGRIASRFFNRLAGQV